MGWLDGPIQQGIRQGTASGMCSVFWREYRLLTSRARAVLSNPKCRVSNDEEIGARDALVDMGLVNKGWFGRYRISDAGRAAIRSSN